MTAVRASSARRRAVVLAWLGNTGLACLVGLGWLGDLPSTSSPLVLAFVPAALVSTLAMLSFPLLLALLLVATLVRHRLALNLAQALLWTLFLLAVWVDTRIWGLFRYHFNGMVWNVMTTPGSEDAIELGPRAWWTVLVAGTALFAAQLFAWSRWLLPARAIEGRDHRLRRVAIVGGWSVAALVLLEKGLYAGADLARDRRVTALSRVFPFYQRLTLQRLARRLGLRLEERPRVEIGEEGLLLRYPLARPRFDAQGPRPSFLVVVIDSLRADALDDETMPRTSAFARGARRFENHLSGGNATRHGVFSMLYGIHGAYWSPTLDEHAPPVLVTELLALGYDLRVISTPSMSFPEFRSNAWVSVEDQVEDALPGATKHEKDASIPGRLARWLAGRERSRPFFAFVLIDAPHGAYDWPREETHFRPYAERVDFLKMSASPTPTEIEQVRNSYRNAVRFADGVAARLVDVVRESGRGDDTVVVITGDHGEEFFEHGHFGHTSSFSPEQVRVAFVMGGPGVKPGVERRWTSHVDLAPTLLEMCGADPADRGKYALGHSLLDPPAERLRVVAAWQEIGLWTQDAILSIPLEGHRGFIEAFDYEWRPIEDDARVLRAAGADVARLAEECRRFLR